MNRVFVLGVYDIGLNSNIETYHIQVRQREFRDAVDEFDKWYNHANQEQRSQGLNQFLQTLNKYSFMSIFFDHYRYINLENIQIGNFTSNDSGKLTVEFRNFRPPKNPATAQAFAFLLFNIMEKMSIENNQEPFVWIAPSEYDRFNTGTKVEEDWTEVRKELGLRNQFLDAAIKEYVTAIHRQAFPIEKIPGSELYPAYSEKNKKGTFFEIRLPVGQYRSEPNIEYGGH